MIRPLRPVAFACVLVCTSSAAATETFDDATARTRAEKFGLMRTNPGPDYARLMTRADLMVYLVRAIGQESTAALLQGTPSFPDVAPDAWYSGSIALAKNAGFAYADPDGNFRPLGYLTRMELVAFLAHLVTLPPDATQTWPESFLVPAVDAGILSTDQADEIRSQTNASTPVGDVVAVADRFFYAAHFPEGDTLFQRYWSLQDPVLTLVHPADGERLARMPIYEGSAETADARFYPLSLRILVDGSAAGQATFEAGGPWFQAGGALSGGQHTFVAELTDFAGRQVSIERTFEVAGAADLSIAPDHVDFPAQQAGTTSPPAQLLLSNAGTSSATLSAIEVPDGFLLLDATANGCDVGTEVAVGGDCVLLLAFSPESAAHFDGELAVRSDDGSLLQVPVSGIGTEAPGGGGTGGGGGSAGEGGTGGSGGNTGTGGTGGSGGSGGGTLPQEHDAQKDDGSGCSQAAGSSLSGLLLLGAALLRRRRAH